MNHQDCLTIGLHSHFLIVAVQAAGETAVISGFSENYSFIRVKGFHWYNVQATVHPFVAHYSQNEMTYQFCYYT
jgi:hypothetical protein